MNRWVIVLAGGEGVRMRPFTEARYGQHRPKQYCAFTSGKSMLEHTFDRALDLAPAERLVTILGSGHTRYLRTPRLIKIPGQMLVQPENRDTGPGVFLPLAKVMSQDPDALVAIFPSDHFIYPRRRFQAVVEDAFHLAKCLPTHIILLAATPDRPESDYGWICAGPTFHEDGARLVTRFQEKPSVTAAEQLYRAGSLWNTMIVVARAAALWDLAREVQPEMIRSLECIKSRMNGAGESQAITMAYRDMGRVNFSRDFLEKISEWTVALPMRDVNWCDWGRPERVMKTLEYLGYGGDIHPQKPPRLSRMIAVTGPALI
jgi:mannose-1-phosphate guanylyltransferase